MSEAPSAIDLASLWRAVATHPGIVVQCEGDAAADAWNRLAQAMEAAGTGDATVADVMLRVARQENSRLQAEVAKMRAERNAVLAVAVRHREALAKIAGEAPPDIDSPEAHVQWAAGVATSALTVVAP